MTDWFISRFNFFSLDAEGLTVDNLPERTKGEFAYAPNSNSLVICLPGWGQELWSWKLVKNYAFKNNVSFVAYEFPRGILSDQKLLTKECFEVISKYIREDIASLKKEHGFKKCILVCVSLASSFGSMVYKDNPDINEIIHVAAGENLARDMWHGCRTQHLRKSYEKQRVTEAELEKSWADLASENNFPYRGTKISIHLGKADSVIPYRLSKKLPEVLQTNGFQNRNKTYSLGHYFLIFKLLLNPSKVLLF